MGNHDQAGRDRSGNDIEKVGFFGWKWDEDKLNRGKDTHKHGKHVHES